MSGAAKLVWIESPAGLADALDAWWERVLGRIPRELSRAGSLVVRYAKSNHRWRNRTGEAEAGLHAEVFREGDTFVLEIRHSVYYGVFLEGRFGGRWGVLPDAVDYGGLLVQAAAISAMAG